MATNCWLLLEKTPETMISKGIDKYSDVTGKAYHYDSLVPNYKRLKAGDLVVLRTNDRIYGTGMISNISSMEGVKTHRRCTKCRSTDIRERTTKKPNFKCGNCAHEFDAPIQTQASVQEFIANFENFSKFVVPPSVAAVKDCALKNSGKNPQLSMLQLHPEKIGNLINRVIFESSEVDADVKGGGQGFGLSAEQKKAVEIRAMTVAKESYESEGWEMVDTSSNNPFDFRAKRGKVERFIEVKGTTGAGENVVLTHGEVNHVRNHPNQSALIVVTGIKLVENQGVFEGVGGAITVRRDPWTIEDHCLTATQYRYDLECAAT